MLVKDIPEVMLHQGDGLDESMKVLDKVQGDIKPLFFLDGDHAYDSVTRELAGIMKACPGRPSSSTTPSTNLLSPATMSDPIRQSQTL